MKPPLRSHSTMQNKNPSSSHSIISLSDSRTSMPMWIKRKRRSSTTFKPRPRACFVQQREVAAILLDLPHFIHRSESLDSFPMLHCWGLKRRRTSTSTFISTSVHPQHQSHLVVDSDAEGLLRIQTEKKKEQELHKPLDQTTTLPNCASASSVQDLAISKTLYADLKALRSEIQQFKSFSLVSAAATVKATQFWWRSTQSVCQL